jgi:hypothetical protein
MAIFAISLDRQDQMLWNPPQNSDYSINEMNIASEKLQQEIFAGKPWDEDIEAERADMLCDIERVMFDSEDDKLGRLRDCMSMYIKRYCDRIVRNDPDKYCGE